jgi:hypothetical protein
VTELNAATGTLIKVLAASPYKFDSPQDLASDGTHVWVTNGDGDTVTEFPASTK